MKAHFQMFADYNKWANERLYETATLLSDEDRKLDRGVFFGSLHNTLNHLLVGDLFWMHRFTGTGRKPAALNECLHDDFEELRADRAIEDQRIIDHVGGLSNADLSGFIEYARVGQTTKLRQNRAEALAHFFNHQTHHRGQCHALLTGFGVTTPGFDLLFYQRELETGVPVLS